MPAHLVPPRAIEVRDRFPIDRAALIDLLRVLDTAEWSRPTVCADWDVRDVALHILGGDLSNISRRRDGVQVPTWGPGEDAGAFLARVNQEWVAAARHFSSRLVIELLESSGPALFAYFKTLDPAALGGPVSWAGRGPAPVWLDLAREYMERWVHQQHIRDAVRRPGQSEARFARPVIAASMHALPMAMDKHAGHEHGAVVIEIPGSAGGAWSVVREDQRWRLFEGAAEDARATVEVAAEDWWRVVTLGVRPEDAWSAAKIAGDRELARAVFTAIAIIA